MLTRKVFGKQFCLVRNYNDQAKKEKKQNFAHLQNSKLPLIN